MAIFDLVLQEFLSSVPSYVWIGLVLMAIGVILLIIPVVFNGIGRTTFIAGLLIIAIPALFTTLWNNNTTFRYLVVGLGGLAIIGAILLGGSSGKVSRR